MPVVGLLLLFQVGGGRYPHRGVHAGKAACTVLGWPDAAFGSVVVFVAAVLLRDVGAAIASNRQAADRRTWLPQARLLAACRDVRYVLGNELLVVSSPEAGELLAALEEVESS